MLLAARFMQKKKGPQWFALRAFQFGSPTWARTRDLRINSPTAKST